MSTYLNAVKSVPIIDFASRKGFTLFRVGRYYSLAEHDSVRIDNEKNCFWRNSVFFGKGSGGAGSIIDFALEFFSYKNAAAAIAAIASDYGISHNNTVIFLYAVHPNFKVFIII